MNISTWMVVHFLSFSPVHNTMRIILRLLTHAALIKEHGNAIPLSFAHFSPLIFNMTLDVHVGKSYKRRKQEICFRETCE